MATMTGPTALAEVLRTARALAQTLSPISGEPPSLVEELREALENTPQGLVIRGEVAQGEPVALYAFCGCRDGRTHPRGVDSWVGRGDWHPGESGRMQAEWTKNTRLSSGRWPEGWSLPHVLVRHAVYSEPEVLVPSE